MAFTLFSAAFSEGASIPELHTCLGADLSPSIEWRDPPAGTRSFALIVDDPDAPGGNWCHWLLYDLGAKVTALAQGYKPGSVGLSGANDFGKPGYGGPCPPKGGPHRYFFKLYALDMHTLGLPAGVRRAELLKAIEGHVLAQAVSTGKFQRK